MLWRSQIWAIGESILSSYQHHRRTVKVTKAHRLRPTAPATPHPLRRNRSFDNVFQVTNAGAQYQWGHPTLFADLPKVLLFSLNSHIFQRFETQPAWHTNSIIRYLRTIRALYRADNGDIPTDVTWILKFTPAQQQFYLRSDANEPRKMPCNARRKYHHKLIRDVIVAEVPQSRHSAST